MEFIFATSYNIEEIFPQSLLNYFPFKAESLGNWENESDINNFLIELFEGTGYSDYGEYLFQIYYKEFISIAEDFKLVSSKQVPAPASTDNNIQIPDINKHVKFGFAFKYVAAIKGILHNVLSESAFFSLSHILEIESDIDSSILLAKNLYYKHSYQVLRGLIESLVYLLHFTDNHQDFELWRTNQYHGLRIRGRRGLLNDFVDRQIILPDLKNDISNICGELNNYVHGNEFTLINQGIYEGEWKGYFFKDDYFSKWCEILSETISICIKVLRIHLSLWEDMRPTDREICAVCHEDSFNVSKKTVNEIEIKQFDCLNCGNKMEYNLDGTPVVITTINRPE